ncbi:MAG: oligosaccharide flippase family protein [Dehalococcoidia bacterium]
MTARGFVGGLRRRAGVRATAIAGAQLFNQAATLVMMVLAARALLPHDYGLFALALATAMAVSLIPGVGLDWAAVRISSAHAVVDSLRAHDTLLAGAYLKAACAGIVSLALLVVGGPIALFALDRPGVGAALFVGALAAFALAITNYSLSTLQARMLHARFISLNLAAGSIRVAAFALIPLALGLSMPGAYVLYIVVLYVTASGCALLSLADLRPSHQSRRPIFAELIAYARWLTPAAILGTVLSSLDLYGVSFLGSAEALGRYAAARTMALGVGAVAIVVSSTLLPRASRITDRAVLMRFMLVTELVLLVFVACVATGAVLAPLIFHHALGDKYAHAVPAFRLLIAAFSIDVLVSPAMLLVLVGSRPDLLTWVNGIVLAITLGAFALLLPGHGATMAASITLAARAMLAVGTVAAAAHIWRRPTGAHEEARSPEPVPQSIGV